MSKSVNTDTGLPHNENVLSAFEINPETGERIEAEYVTKTHLSGRKKFLVKASDRKKLKNNQSVSGNVQEDTVGENAEQDSAEHPESIPKTKSQSKARSRRRRRKKSESAPTVVASTQSKDEKGPAKPLVVVVMEPHQDDEPVRDPDRDNPVFKETEAEAPIQELEELGGVLDMDEVEPRFNRKKRLWNAPQLTAEVEKGFQAPSVTEKKGKNEPALEGLGFLLRYDTVEERARRAKEERRKKVEQERLKAKQEKDEEKKRLTVMVNELVLLGFPEELAQKAIKQTGAVDPAISLLMDMTQTIQNQDRVMDDAAKNKITVELSEMAREIGNVYSAESISEALRRSNYNMDGAMTYLLDHCSVVVENPSVSETVWKKRMDPAMAEKASVMLQRVAESASGKLYSIECCIQALNESYDDSVKGDRMIENAVNWLLDNGEEDSRANLPTRAPIQSTPIPHPTPLLPTPIPLQPNPIPLLPTQPLNYYSMVPQYPPMMSHYPPMYNAVQPPPPPDDDEFVDSLMAQLTVQ